MIEVPFFNCEMVLPAGTASLALPGQSPPQLHRRMLRRHPALMQRRLGLPPPSAPVWWTLVVAPPAPRQRPPPQSGLVTQPRPIQRRAPPPAWLGLQTGAWQKSCAQPPRPTRTVSVITPDIGLLGG